MPLSFPIANYDTARSLATPGVPLVLRRLLVRTHCLARFVTSIRTRKRLSRRRQGWLEKDSRTCRDAPERAARS